MPLASCCTAYWGPVLGLLINATGVRVFVRFGDWMCRNELWGVDFPGTAAKPGYMQLYNASARAVKSVDPSLKVGGPATAGLADLPAFVAACSAMGLPKPDFVSSHHCTLRQVL